MEKLNELVELVKEYNSATTAEEALAINNQFKATANRETILAIAEAFRALEQEKEAAEAKLAGLAKQEPMGRVDRGAVSDSNEYPDARVVCLHEHVGWEAFQDGCELFTRPAPAINLAELVPSIEALRAEFEEVERKSDDGFNLHRYDTVYADDETQERWDLWLSCRAAILRNIEGSK